MIWISHGWHSCCWSAKTNAVFIYSGEVLGKVYKDSGFYQKKRKSCWKNIRLRLILNIQPIGLMGFVGEKNYHFIERLAFLRRLCHSLQSRNFMRSCYEKRNVGHLHCATLPMWTTNPCLLFWTMREHTTQRTKDSDEVWFSNGKSGLHESRIRFS